MNTKRLTYSIIIIIFSLFLFYEALFYIKDITPPLFGDKYVAQFYYYDENDLDRKDLVYIGSGYIYSDNNNYSATDTSEYDIEAPELTTISDNEFIEWTIVQNIDNTFSVIGIKHSSSTTSEPTILSVETVSDLISSPFALGNYVQTKGYYAPNDSGDALYLITNEIPNGYDKILLSNGYTASLITDNNKISISQVGAHGDGITDDSGVINWALNSSYTCVYFQEKKYKCDDRIVIKNGNKDIIGNNCSLFTTNNFRGTSWWFIQISCDNIIIENVNIDALENDIVKYKGQIGLKNCSNISLIGLNLTVPNTVKPIDSSGNIKQYTNLDLNTGWSNVNIENCSFRNYSNALAGSCIWIRDMEDQRCTTLCVQNCYFSKTTHDESLAIFHGYISDVKILNNTFEAIDEDKLSSPTDFLISIGNASSKECSNILIDGNTFIGSGENFLIVVGNMSDVTVSNNYFDFTKITKQTFYVFWKLESCSPSVLEVHDNIFNIHSNMDIDNFFAVACNYSGNTIYTGPNIKIKKMNNQNQSLNQGGNTVLSESYLASSNVTATISQGKNGIYYENGNYFYYVDNNKQTTAGLIEEQDEYYYIQESSTLATNKSLYISKTNNLIPAARYEFDSDGCLKYNGIYTENDKLYLYIDGKKQTNVGLVEYEGKYYYIQKTNALAQNKSLYITQTNNLLPKGRYSFNSDGVLTR